MLQNDFTIHIFVLLCLKKHTLSNFKTSFHISLLCEICLIRAKHHYSTSGSFSCMDNTLTVNKGAN
ncbi:hypothetical protein T11_17016 [Trichinella zimbabwensis]|uniref:Uncharacterized protein n=1 Tax=Trichinella zimbabwensis TaxID=268475 RepID=A0A0V1HNC9_9BILA|nr:hypothetical protein T11_17016 [Trichinella zimbabwensis]